MDTDICTDLYADSLESSCVATRDVRPEPESFSVSNARLKSASTSFNLSAIKRPIPASLKREEARQVERESRTLAWLKEKMVEFGWWRDFLAYMTRRGYSDPW